jgi:hypothetical protein
MKHPLRYVIILFALVLIAWYVFQGKLALTPDNERYRGVRNFSRTEEVELLLNALHDGLIDLGELEGSKVGSGSIWDAKLQPFLASIEKFYPPGTGGFLTASRVYRQPHFARVKGHWLNDTYLNLELSTETRFDSFTGEAVPAGTRVGLENCDVKRRNPRGSDTAQLFTRGIRCEFAQLLRSALLATPPAEPGARLSVDAQIVVTELGRYLSVLQERGGIDRFESDLPNDQVRIWLPGKSVPQIVYVFPYLVNPYPTLEIEELATLQALQNGVTEGGIIFSSRERVLAPLGIHRDRLVAALSAAASTDSVSGTERRERFFETLSPRSAVSDPYERFQPNGEFQLAATGYETSGRDPTVDGQFFRRVLAGQASIANASINTTTKNLFCYEVPYGPECCAVLKTFAAAAGLRSESLRCDSDNFETTIPGGELSIAPTVERTCRGALNDAGYGQCLLLSRMR